jgi:hypothetical protein
MRLSRFFLLAMAASLSACLHKADQWPESLGDPTPVDAAATPGGRTPQNVDGPTAPAGQAGMGGDSGIGGLAGPGTQDANSPTDVEQPAGGCAPAEKSCIEDVLRTCDPSGVVSSTMCPYGCDGVRKECNVCRPNSRACEGGSSIVCNAEGSGTSTIVCTSGCNDTAGECIGCLPSTVWCTGDVLRECTATGEPRDRQTCEFGCSSGRMACNTCRPGAKACNGNILETCSADGAGVAAEPCSSGCNKARLACNTCLPGAKACSGSTHRTCRGDGSGWTDQDCPNGCSSDGCNACRPNQATCTGGILQVCKGDGSGLNMTTCPNGCRSDGPECLTCSSSQHACNGRCANNSSPLTCGNRCDPCPSSENAEATCDGTNCGTRCRADSALCTDGRCAPNRWSFESTSVDGFTISGDFNAAVSLETSGAQAYEGARALRVRVEASSARDGARIRVPLCPGANRVELRGKEISARVRLEGPPVQASMILDINDVPQYGYTESAFPGTWFVLAGRVAPEEVTHMNHHFEIWITIRGGAEWRGDIWIDDVRVE